MCLAARANLALQRLDLSRDYLETTIRQYPGFAVAHDLFGDLLLVEGKVNDAIHAYETSLRIDASRTMTSRKLASAKQLIAHADARADSDQDGGGQVPGRKTAYADELRAAEQHEKDGELSKAEAIYRDILKKDPDHVDASRLLAGIAAANEHFEEAEVFLRKATELAPAYARAWVELANVQRQLEAYDDAITSAMKVIELSPDKAESYMLYASVLGAAGRHEDAIDVYAKVIALSPKKAGAMCSMAHHLKTIGRRKDAVAQYRAAIAARSDYSEAYWSLANLKTFRFVDAEVAAMQELLDTNSLGAASAAQIHNALGLDFEARKDFDRAFAHFEQCNKLQRNLESYDPVDTEATHDRVIELFDDVFLQQPPGDAVHPTPIFIVGLPRSGSTLIEQILASHSMVEGTHELSDLSKVLLAMRRRTRKDVQFPQILAPLKSAGWSRIASQYIERTEKHRIGAPCFVDKNPNNFIFIGLLKLAMPNAKIIDARRHPLDSCLGSFKQLFASGQPFSYDMTELAEYYIQYQRLMDHWHRVLPGFVLTVNYEDIVGDLTGQVSRLLDFCGLPFEESCLRFHETVRAVKTASSEQVRRPIYSTSVNLWRNYERHLDTLIEILEPLLLDLPEFDRPSKSFLKKQNRK